MRSALKGLDRVQPSGTSSMETDEERIISAASFASEEFQMHVSPPITVLAIMAAMVAGAVWLAPPQREMAQVTVVLPTATYQKLALWGKEHAGADGRPLTAVQVIEELANQAGTRVR